MKTKLFFDTDVILDIAIDRKPFSDYAVDILSKVELGVYQGYTSAIIFSNVYYVCKKLMGHSFAIKFLKKLRLILNVLSVDDVIIQKSLESDFSDFEDAIQHYTAIKNKMDFIITRNIEDYKKSIIPICSPSDFINTR